MTRYYYRDPLAAAFMAKHHGMKLEGRHTDEQMSEYDLEENQRWFDWFDTCIVDGWQHDVEMVSDAVRFIEEASDKIYVKPESESLLSPMVGDVVQHNEIEFGLVIGCDNGEVGIQYCDDSDGTTLCGMAPIEETLIIQRNRKPFFWPEREVESV